MELFWIKKSEFGFSLCHNRISINCLLICDLVLNKSDVAFNSWKWILKFARNVHINWLQLSVAFDGGTAILSCISRLIEASKGNAYFGIVVGVDKNCTRFESWGKVVPFVQITKIERYFWVLKPVWRNINKLCKYPGG
jgi:hypothetical protein